MWSTASASDSGTRSCPVAVQGTELAGAAAAAAPVLVCASIVCTGKACAIRPMRKAIAIRFIRVLPLRSNDYVDRAGLIAVARVRDAGARRVRDLVGVGRLPRLGRERLGGADVDDNGVVVVRLVVPRHEVALL